MIGILFDDITSTLSAAILTGIYTALRAAGYHILVQSSDHTEERTAKDIERDQECLRWFYAQKVEGVIVVDSRANPALPEEKLADGGLPLVYVNRIWQGAEAESHTFVYPDDRGAGAMATQHLIQLGHRAIGYINGPEERCSCGSERFLGFQDALAAAGLSYRDEWVMRGDWTAESGYAAAQRILSQPERPTAIFAANDLMAIGCIAAARQLGLNVPQDLALIGFDNRSPSIYAEPALTTVTLPGSEMGTIAVELMVKILQGGEPVTGGVVVPSQLIVRNSCGSGKVPIGKWLRDPIEASILRTDASHS